MLRVFRCSSKSDSKSIMVRQTAAYAEQGSGCRTVLVYAGVEAPKGVSAIVREMGTGEGEVRRQGRKGRPKLVGTKCRSCNVAFADGHQ